MASDVSERHARRRTAQQLFDELAVAQADGLVAAGLATRVQGGRATMRGWIGIPSPDQGCTDQWRDLISETYRYSASLTPSPDRTVTRP